MSEPVAALDELVLRPNAPEDSWVLRHVMGRRPHEFADDLVVAKHTGWTLFRWFLAALAVICVFAVVAIMRHGWTPDSFKILVVALTIIFLLLSVMMMLAFCFSARSEAQFFPRRLEVFRDRVLVTLHGCPSVDFAARKVFVRWGRCGSDRFLWGYGRDPALLLEYWGWRSLPRDRHTGWTFAITGSDEQLAAAYELLLKAGIRPRQPTIAEVLGPVLAVAALTAGLWAVW